MLTYIFMKYKVLEEYPIFKSYIMAIEFLITIFLLALIIH